MYRKEKLTLRSARERLGLTQAQAGEALGWSGQYWGRLEKRETLTTEQLFAIAKALDLQPTIDVQSQAVWWATPISVQTQPNSKTVKRKSWGKCPRCIKGRLRERDNIVRDITMTFVYCDKECGYEDSWANPLI